MTVTHKKAARILENWNLGSETITDIYYEGTGNRNESACYVGEEYVLKYTSNPGRMKKNMELSRALDNVGLLSALPVPAVNGADCITDGEVYYYLTRRLPGNTMASRRFNREKGVFTGEIIGRLHLALAGLDACTGEADLVEKLRSWALPAAKDILKLSESFCREYLGSFAALYEKLPRQIIHRDPHPGNILCEGDKWGFLDFELAERNVRIYDPCYAATAVLSETFDTDREGWIDIFRALLRGYDSVVGLTPEERRAVPYVILANQFVCVAWFAGQEKYAEIFETNRRMTLWLLERMEELKKF